MRQVMSGQRHGIRRAIFWTGVVLAFAPGCRVKNPPTAVAIQQDGMSHVALPSAWGGKPGTPSSPDQNWILTFNDRIKTGS